MSKPTPTSIRLSDPERAAIADLARTQERSESDVIRRLVADGLRRKMERAAHSIKSEYLDALHDPAAVSDLFLRWADAMCAAAGVPGPLGSKYRLREGPQGYLPAPISADRPEINIKQMLAALRSADLEERIAAGIVLATSLGAGFRLTGEDATDFEYLIAPEWSDLIGRAMAGESAAVDELAERITPDLDKAHRPQTAREPSREPEWTN